MLAIAADSFKISGFPFKVIPDGVIVVSKEVFIKEINSQSKRAYSIFYKIECRKFIEGKYRYYKIHISNDLLSDNFNDILLNPKNYISNTDVNIKENNHITNNNNYINSKKA